MNSKHGQTSACTAADARAHLRRAESFLAAGQLIVETGQDPQLELAGVAAALAVLAGIAASDAACCHALGKPPRGRDHGQASSLLATVHPDGPAMAKELRRLLDLKDNAHYGTIPVSAQDAQRAARLLDLVRVTFT